MPTVELAWSIVDHISLAFHQNAIPVVQEISVGNTSGADLVDVTIELSAEPTFLGPTNWKIQSIADGTTHHLRTPDLKLDVPKLLKLVEGVRAEATVVVRQGEVELARSAKDVRLLPPSHWGGTSAAPELLAAFVRPNDPVVDVILHEAATRLGQAERNNSLDGYRSNKKSHVWEVAEAIWNALASHSIRYVYPPSSFERIGQKVRHPSDIVDRGVGTCLDLTLCYAACLAQAGLNPLLVLVNGHAFAGLWLKDEQFPATVVDDVQLLRKHRDLDEMVFVETTLLTHEPPGRFAAAIRTTAEHLVETSATPFELAIDVRGAWARQVRPLDLGQETVALGRSSGTAPTRDLELDAPPPFVEEVLIEPAEAATFDRLEMWKRRLLDLTLRNKLINFKSGKNAITIECPEPGTLEDLLAQGMAFKILPRSTVLAEGDERSATLLAERHHDDGRRQSMLAAMGQGVLHTLTPERDLEGVLTDLFRIAKTSFEEGGANVLFLAIGFLLWKQQEGTPALRAPLLLIPVRLARSSVRAGFRLSLHEEEARLNPTLLQMLRQDFELRMPGLEGELPTDRSGLDVAKIWRIVRHHILSLKGWEVKPDVVLSTFSFTKFLMWKDLVDRVEMLKRSPVVRHLIDTPKHTYGDGADFSKPSDIDRTVHPADLFAPLMADSSQLAAVLAAAAGKDFVLFGPPGTGKSQTIANLIAHCLAHGKTILFVSQKTAALEVVQRRLQDLGLGEFCLEIHSSKAQKSAVLAQLKNAWHERSQLSEGDWRAKGDELQGLRQQLNELVASLHRRRANGMTAHLAIGKVVAARERFGSVALDWPMERELSAEELAGLRRACHDLETALRSVGSLADHPLQGLAIEEWRPVWRNEMMRAIDDLVGMLATFPAAIQDLAKSIGLDGHAAAPGALEALSRLGSALYQPEAAVAWRLLDDRGRQTFDAVEELKRLQAKRVDLRHSLSMTYRDEILDDEDPGLLLADWQAACSANFLTRALRQNAFRKGLARFTNGQPPADPEDDLTTLSQIKELHRRAERLAPRFASLLEGRWTGLNSPADRLDALVDWAASTRRASDQVNRSAVLSEPLVQRVVGCVFDRPDSPSAMEGVRRAHTQFQEAWRAIQDQARDVADLANLDEVGLPTMAEPEWIDATTALLDRWKGSLGPPANAWSQWVLIERRARAAGLGPIIDAARDGVIAADEIEAAFEATHARWWADKVISDDPVLGRFLPEPHEDRIDQFRRLDDEIRTLSKTVVRARLSGDIPRPTAFGADPEWGTLSREITKRARHMPLRQLFQKIPSVLTRLAPCVMMSPLSIAQYLPPDAEPFDLVVFDEASQMAVWDAIGAIARGKQVIVVGDPEQLPPTSIGERGVDGVDDGSDVTDQESILDECIACNIPRHYLSWHYRSRHESLIAFSNQKYYQGRLVSFPSPVTEDRAVHYVHVPGGVYERGTGRVNREEARAVAADVVRRLTHPSFASERLSLGIVTFNAEQQRLIENLLDQERRSHPEIETFFNPEQWHEPVFVKNLENVQGDERDVIIFSVAVGPDADGRVGATISSLNREGGHRRLNVGVTRARRELCVFATLRPEQIDLSRSRARGVHDFKHFLEFAERGPRALAEAFTLTGRDTESPFEDAVKEALEIKGWQVHPQIGVSSFRIDLGIVHPDAPGRYLAGVECDGATYHRSAAARDRDRLREMVLTGLGWTIRRVWSLEWWGDKETAIAKLHDRLTADLAADRVARPQPIPIEPDIQVRVPPEVEAEGEQEADPVDLLPPPEPKPAPLPANSRYVLANPLDCGMAAEPDRFYDPAYGATLKAIVDHVIEIEGPIFADVLAVRIARAHGFQRTGTLIRSAVMAAVHDRVQRSQEGDRTVLWPASSKGTDQAAFRPSAGVRDSNDIPFQELVSLAETCLGSSRDAGDVVQKMRHHLQIGRLKEPTRVRLEKAAMTAMSAD